MRNKNIFCSRKSGVTLSGVPRKFTPLPRYSTMLARDLERASNKQAARRERNDNRMGSK